MPQISRDEMNGIVQAYDPNDPAELSELLRLAETALEYAADGDLASTEIEDAHRATLRAATDLSKVRAHVPDEELRP